jgi:hypothetical protein
MRTDLMNHNKQEKDQLDKLLQWKWMIVGGIAAVVWLASNGLEFVKTILTK